MAHVGDHLSIEELEQHFRACEDVCEAASIARTLNAPPAIIPNSGGSLPNDIFTEGLGMPTIWVPHSYRGCSQHAPNEHLPLPIAREALGLMAGIYWDLGKGGTPATHQESGIIDH